MKRIIRDRSLTKEEATRYNKIREQIEQAIPPSADFYTLDQLMLLLKQWSCTDPPPGKGQKLLVCFPAPAEPNMVTIRLHDQKSTYGKRLWKLIWSHQ